MESMVVGVDTHKDSHSAALLDAVGGVRATLAVQARLAGYKELLSWARARSEQRIWVIEGTGSYGAGLTAFLSREGEGVFEGDHPKRPARGAAGKSDELDAIRVAREALGRTRHATPRRRGEREMIRVLLTAREGAITAYRQGLNQLHALAVTAPDQVRDQLRGLHRERLVKGCLRLRATGDPEGALTASTLRAVARRVDGLAREAREYELRLAPLVASAAPALLAQQGVGTLVAAQLLSSWSHAGRIRDENAFAAFAGVAPVPASSGRIQRHRLNRMGDRRLNRALHTVALVRSSHDRETKEYIARRTAQGKSLPEIRRCLKRYIARRLFRLLEGLDWT